MKRKEIINGLDEIKATIQTETSVNYTIERIDKLIDDIQIEEDKPGINVTVNINNPEKLDLTELSEKVKEMIICEWGRL